MHEGRPLAIWISFSLFVAAIIGTIWQPVVHLTAVPLSTDDPTTLVHAAAVLGLRLAAASLLVGLPAVGILFGLGFCRTLLTIFALPTLVSPLFYSPAGGWTLPAIIVTFIQAPAVVLLYVKSSNAYFRRTRTGI